MRPFDIMGDTWGEDMNTANGLARLNPVAFGADQPRDKDGYRWGHWRDDANSQTWVWVELKKSNVDARISVPISQESMLAAAADPQGFLKLFARACREIRTRIELATQPLDLVPHE